MASANTSSVKMDSGLKMGFFANANKKEEKGYVQNQQAKGEVNASKAQQSAARKKKEKAKAKKVKQSRRKNK